MSMRERKVFIVFPQGLQQTARSYNFVFLRQTCMQVVPLSVEQSDAYNKFGILFIHSKYDSKYVPSMFSFMFA